MSCTLGNKILAKDQYQGYIKITHDSKRPPPKKNQKFRTDTSQKDIQMENNMYKSA